MQEVYIKFDELKNKFLNLLSTYKNLQAENINLKNKVNNLEGIIKKQKTYKIEDSDNEEVRIKVESCLREIDGVIKILS